jgi:hypothetical protein
VTPLTTLALLTSRGLANTTAHEEFESMGENASQYRSVLGANQLLCNKIVTCFPCTDTWRTPSWRSCNKCLDVCTYIFPNVGSDVFLHDFVWSYLHGWGENAIGFATDTAYVAWLLTQLNTNIIVYAIVDALASTFNDTVYLEAYASIVLAAIKKKLYLESDDPSLILELMNATARRLDVGLVDEYTTIADAAAREIHKYMNLTVIIQRRYTNNANYRSSHIHNPYQALSYITGSSLIPGCLDSDNSQFNPSATIMDSSYCSIAK